jgi:hypothetical protein
VARADSEELSRNIRSAQRELADVRKEIGNDSETLAALKAVEQHLAAASQHQKLLHEECNKDSVNRTACMKHCNAILLELDKAQAEHDALIRSIEMRTHSAAESTTTTQRNR